MKAAIEARVKAEPGNAKAFSVVAAQCAAKTEDGVQCKYEAVEGGKYCWQHAKAVGTCAAMTEDGKKCTRKTEPGQKYCWQHAKAKSEAKKPAAK